jgi:hypothetical protein
MDTLVEVPIPVTPQAAALPQDAERARTIGRLVSEILRPASPHSDPLAAVIAELKAEARADGLTHAEIDAELAPYNAQGRV